MMKRRFRRRGARWSFADSAQLEWQATVTTTAPFVWLLPPARVAYMLSQRGRANSLIYAGSHLWLDFSWRMEGNTQNLQDVDFGVIKTTISDPASFAPDLSLVDAQWDQPSTPATLTSWNEDDDSGVDSWLWQHHVKGSSPPNAYVTTIGGVSPGAGTNQYVQAQSGTSDVPTYVCRKFHVTQEWQPDVVIRSKRRLQKDEGILLYMNVPGGGVSGQFIRTDVRFRTLTK